MCFIFLTCTIVIQKPGGIVALLDEAWYVIRNKTVIGLLLFPSISFSYETINLFGPCNIVFQLVLYFLICDVALVILCSMFPRSTHETFAEKLYQTFKDHKRFSKPKLSRSDFTICHYAGDVSV